MTTATNKTERVLCLRCRGSGMIEARFKNHGTCTYIWGIVGCDDCCGKGYRVPKEEVNRVYVSVSYPGEQPYGRSRV